MKVFFSTSDYQSHARASADYRALFAQHATLVSRAEDADIIFLHQEPQTYAALLETLPRDRYIIAYAVFEADPLPIELQRGLRYVDEVWTASRYCVDLFAAWHPRVRHLPHVVQRSREVEQVVLPTDTVNLLHIGFGNRSRKNQRQLRRVFAGMHARNPRFRLVLKDGAHCAAIEEAGVIHIRELLSEAQMTSLYLQSASCISVHHGEGWGFVLSDAMLLGVPAVATAYSGNLDYMTEANSTLIPARAEAIRAEDVEHYFRASMRWGYVDDVSIEASISASLQARDKCVAAQREMERFAPGAVGDILAALLKKI